MTPFQYSNEEESSLLLLNRDDDGNIKSKRKKSSSSSSSVIIRAAVLGACVTLGSLAFVASSSSSSSSSSRAPQMMMRKLGDATSGEEAYLGTLPKRTWGSNGASGSTNAPGDGGASTTTTTSTSIDHPLLSVDRLGKEEQGDGGVASGEMTSNNIEQQKQQPVAQQQQQQGPTKPQALEARVWQKSESFVEDDEEERAAMKEQEQREQQHPEEREQEQQQQPNQEQQVEEQPQQQREEEQLQPEEQKPREEVEVLEVLEAPADAVLVEDNKEESKVAESARAEEGPNVVVAVTREEKEDVKEVVVPASVEEVKEEVQEEVKEEEKQPIPRWRLNMQNIAHSASDALKRRTSTISNEREQQQEQHVVEDGKEQEKQRIDAEIEEQRRQIDMENEQKRKEEEEEAAAKVVEPEMGEDEAPPRGVMENLYDIDNGRYEGEVVQVPFAFYANTKWAGADFWKHDWDTPNMSDEQKAKPDPTKFMPVFKTHGVDSADVVVTAHATNIKSTGWVIVDSAKRNGLQVVISGNGTDFHGFADKMMGLKAALHSINGNPIVINTDANDVMLQCSGQEFKNRFNQANADFIFGGETQLWPEIHAYFEKTDEIAWKEKMSDTLGKIGAAGPPAQLTGAHPNVWANAGSFMARKNDMLKYIEETEQRMARHPGSEPDEWGMTCRPAGVTDEDFADVNGSGWVNWFDDQECLTSFQMRHLMDRSLRHKLDADGSILFSAGGTPMDQIGKDNKNMVFHKETGKASCLWHFNNPQAKIRLKDFANAFPDKFLTPHGREVMLSTSDEHPGNRDPGPSSAAAFSARSSARAAAN